MPQTLSEARLAGRARTCRRGLVSSSLATASPMTGHSRRIGRRAAVISALLLAGVAVAVIGATAALGVVGNGAFGPGGKTLTQADVRRALAQQSAPASPTQATPRSSAPASPAGPASATVSFAS